MKKTELKDWAHQQLWGKRPANYTQERSIIVRRIIERYGDLELNYILDNLAASDLGGCHGGGEL